MYHTASRVQYDMLLANSSHLGNMNGKPKIFGWDFSVFWSTQDEKGEKQYKAPILKTFLKRLTDR